MLEQDEGSAGDAARSPLNVLLASDFDVITANQLFDLTGRARAVVDQHSLSGLQRSHGRIAFQHFGYCQAGD